ncbi:MAG: HpcH/HpaI aldolase/citrate lyase family protein [Neisseria sp.]|nr:HpcH/HpaI aldolase/citrate lyase family protein [Neisseria sp.]
MLNPHRLGAALYVPAIHPQLMQIAAGEKLAHVRSLIYCTEDAVHPDDLPLALEQLQEFLHILPPQDKRNHFIRLRNPEVMGQVLALRDLHKIRGFVLPKVDAGNLHEYAALQNGPYCLMPTLETADALLEEPMLRLRDILLQPAWRARVLCLRIGGNDLFNHLHMRRPRGVTLYETALQGVIARLVGIFRPYGFHLSAPVFEFLDCPELLAREVRWDLQYGLTGKTAIHPDQVALIEGHYGVSRADKELAEQILSSRAAVFNVNRTMQEVGTHANWAREILAAWEVFGEGMADEQKSGQGG